MKVAFFLLQQELRLIVRCSRLELLKLFQCGSEVRHEIRRPHQIRLLPDCRNALLELIQIRAQWRFKLRDIRKLVNHAGKEVRIIGHIHCFLDQLNRRRARSAILSTSLPLRTMQTSSFRCDFRIRTS